MMARPDWLKEGARWPNRAHSRFVEAAGLRWHVQVAGAGPVMLLLHGTGGATHSWRDMLPVLARDWLVVAPDLPGHGFTSDAPYAQLSLPGMAGAVAGLMQAMELEPHVAVGHSAGAAVLMRMALDGRLPAELIVSVNGAIAPLQGMAGQFFQPIARMLAMAPFVPGLFAWRAGDPAVVDELLGRTGSRLDPEMRAHYHALFRRRGHVGGALGMMANWDLSSLLRDAPALRARLLLVAGALDGMVPPDDAEAVAKRVPDAAVVRLRGLGHLAHEEAPALLCRLIAEAARRHARARPRRGPRHPPFPHLLQFRCAAGRRDGESREARRTAGACSMNAAAPVSTLSGRPQPHAVVIGSGLGGLATAARLGARGWRVTVLERLDRIGGRARVFRQDGFTFDAGPTIVTAPQVLEELWEFCGAKLSDDVTLKPMDPFYRLLFNDGSHFDASGDPERQRAEIAKFSPADVPGYERFFARSKVLYDIGFEKMGTMPYHTLGDLVRSVPDIIRLEGYRSIHGFVSGYMKDERVRIAQSFHPLFIGGNPLSASAIYGLIAYLERTWGVHYAMGGTNTIVEGIARLARSFGADIRLGAEVEAITLSGRRATGVRLSDGELIKADIVVSNADSAWTYAKLLPEAARTKWTDRKLARAKYSMSLFLWYFGTKRRYEDVPHHTIVLGPRYEGLLRDIFRSRRLADDFSLYLHRPSASDPSVAPAGCDAFYVLAPVPNLLGGQDWTALAEDYRRRIEKRLEETILPGLSGEVVTSKVLTPLDFRNDHLAMHGAAFGLEPILLQSAYFRPHNQSEDVERLYFAGAGTHPGAGLPGVITSARILDQVIPHASAFA